ncbi:MAG: DUF4215 domain-containing protein [Polyangiaceae bacterium]
MIKTAVALPLVAGAAALVLASCGARTDLGARGSVEEPPPLEFCGNAIVTADEECDDGNQDDTDACLSTCVLATCGDGVLAKFEACDDGNTVDGDGCTNTCKLPACGDGILQAGEECDDPDPNVCTPLCRAPKCGDGFLRPATEECDAGAGNADRLALVLLDGKSVQPISPVVRSVSSEQFYGYSSASAHTGFEGVTTSNLFLFASPSAPRLSLFSIHGIDLNSSGLSDGECIVQQTFSGLPAGVTVGLTDDDPKEFQLGAAGTAIGDWKYHDNSDGGVLDGLPFPGTWTVQVDSTFVAGVDTWHYVDGDGAPLPLEASFAILEARSDPSPCRVDCTLPRCGDGIVDAGEVCDDGNQLPGDGCSPDCLAF